MISFGPVPSRRLGKSLGINNIPSVKVCSYACTYCQVGRTSKHTIIREQFYSPEVLCREVEKHLSSLSSAEMPDYLTFVSNGEPTLDINLGASILRLKQLGYPVAVITNASLLFDPLVAEELMLADWVSVKVDTAQADIWKKQNRPHKGLSFDQHNQGILDFSAQYKGVLATETMLVNQSNDSHEALTQTASFIKQIDPSTAYLSIPTRPPMLQNAIAPSEQKVNEAFHIFSYHNINTELLLGFEGTNFGHTGNIYEDIVNICTVHPIREEAVQTLIQKNGAKELVLEELIKSKAIRRIEYQSNIYYIRHFNI